jgi:hypothetical protein
MTKRTSIRVTTMGLITLVLAACSGGGGGGAGGGGGVGATSIDACKLLTTSEVEARIGVPVLKVEGGGTPDGAAFCHWYGDDPAVLSKGISLIVAIDNGAARYKGYKDAVADPMAVVGIGTEAHSTTSKAEILSTYEGNVWLMVTPLYSPTGLGLTETFDLAKLALPRAKALK